MTGQLKRATIRCRSPWGLSPREHDCLARVIARIPFHLFFRCRRFAAAAEEKELGEGAPLAGQSVPRGDKPHGGRNFAHGLPASCRGDSTAYCGVGESSSCQGRPGREHLQFGIPIIHLSCIPCILWFHQISCGYRETFTERHPIDTASSATAPPVVRRAYVWLVGFAAALGGFLFGYDTGVIGGAMPALEKYFQLEPRQLGFAVAIVFCGSI